MHLDDIGLGQLWDQISSFFARKTEAGGSLSWSGTTISLIAVAGGTLDSADLNDGLASDAEAAHSLSLSGSSLVLKSVSGATLSTVDLAALINAAVSSGTSGLMSTSHANGTFFSSMSASGRTITLRRPNGSQESETLS